MRQATMTAQTLPIVPQGFSSGETAGAKPSLKVVRVRGRMRTANSEWVRRSCIQIGTAASSLRNRRPRTVLPQKVVKLPTGKPDAGDPLVRFGGRGGRNQSAFPTPISAGAAAMGVRRLCGVRLTAVLKLPLSRSRRTVLSCDLKS